MGTEQGSKFSGDICRNASCIIVCIIENKLLGIFFIDKATEEIIQCVAIALWMKQIS